mmetsp:Transcript_3528/g.12833  ORF Transcript_3528/g.12833 Transcript_3528/m.12833 type:complete len:372 (+) Transcript_3528:3738-4853(+)
MIVFMMPAWIDAATLARGWWTTWCTTVMATSTHTHTDGRWWPKACMASWHAISRLRRPTRPSIIVTIGRDSGANTRYSVSLMKTPQSSDVSSHWSRSFAASITLALRPPRRSASTSPTLALRLSLSSATKSRSTPNPARGPRSSSEPLPPPSPPHAESSRPRFAGEPSLPGLATLSAPLLPMPTGSSGADALELPARPPRKRTLEVRADATSAPAGTSSAMSALPSSIVIIDSMPRAMRCITGLSPSRNPRPIVEPSPASRPPSSEPSPSPSSPSPMGGRMPAAPSLTGADVTPSTMIESSSAAAMTRRIHALRGVSVLLRALWCPQGLVGCDAACRGSSVGGPSAMQRLAAQRRRRGKPFHDTHRPVGLN